MNCRTLSLASRNKSACSLDNVPSTTSCNENKQQIADPEPLAQTIFLFPCNENQGPTSSRIQLNISISLMLPSCLPYAGHNADKGNCV